MLAYSLHKIVTKDETISPNTVTDKLDKKSFDELESMGAVRKPTEKEVELFELGQKAVKPKAAAAKSKPEAKAETKVASEGKTETDGSDLIG